MRDDPDARSSDTTARASDRHNCCFANCVPSSATVRASVVRAGPAAPALAPRGAWRRPRVRNRAPSIAHLIASIRVARCLTRAHHVCITSARLRGGREMPTQIQIGVVSWTRRWLRALRRWAAGGRVTERHRISRTDPFCPTVMMMLALQSTAFSAGSFTVCASPTHTERPSHAFGAVTPA